MPEEFSGAETDAQPFLDRLAAYFKAKPKAMQFTKNRILLTLNLLSKCKVTKQWAQNVRNSIATSPDGLPKPHYFDNWTSFTTTFLKLYGIRNPPQYFHRRMMAYKQNKGQNCRSFYNAFEDYRQQAVNIDKDQAFFHLKQNTFPTFRTQLIMREHPPGNYDEWKDALIQMQEQLDSTRDFDRSDYGGGFGKNTQHSQYQPSNVKGYGPMQVDAIRQQQRGIIRRPTVKPAAKPAHPRLAPHPTAGNLKPSHQKKPVPAKPSSSGAAPRKVICYACNQPGHFARNCKATLRSIDQTHVQQMEHALTRVYGLQGFGQDAEEDNNELDHPLAAYEEGGVFDQYAEAEEEIPEEESLIDFEDEDAVGFIPGAPNYGPDMGQEDQESF
jgi:hypothetical protein